MTVQGPRSQCWRARDVTGLKSRLHRPSGWRSVSGSSCISRANRSAALDRRCPLARFAQHSADTRPNGALTLILLYIDPGAGSMVIQMLIAAAVAIPFFLRTQIARGIARIRGRGRSRSEEHRPRDG